MGVVAHELRAHPEPVRVGQLHVEEDDLRAQRAALRDRGRAVLRLAHDLESLGLEDDACARAKGRVVVHDQDRAGHLQGDCGCKQIEGLYGWPYYGRTTGRRTSASRFTAAPGSSAPNTAEPATNSDAPASAHGPAVETSMPPSTSRAGRSPTSARRRRSLSSECGRNACPPQPGLTVMH